MGKSFLTILAYSHHFLAICSVFLSFTLDMRKDLVFLGQKEIMYGDIPDQR